MIEEYMKFKDEDRLCGVWFVGRLTDHLYASITRVGDELKVDMEVLAPNIIDSDSETKQQLEALLAKVRAMTPKASTEETDKEIFIEFHEKLEGLAEMFLKMKGSGVFIILPTTGKQAREEVAKCPWDKFTNSTGKAAN